MTEVGASESHGESSATGARNGLKPTASTAASYELPW